MAYHFVDYMRHEGFHNESSEDIPPWSLLFVVGQEVVEGKAILKCDKIGDTFYRTVAINGEFTVAAGEYGSCYRSSPAQFRYAGASPTLGTSYGPKPDEFDATIGFPGVLTVNGVFDTTNKLARGTFCGTIDRFLGFAVTDLAANTSYNSTSDYKIYGGTVGSESDCGFTTLPSIYMRVPVAKGKKFTVEWINNGWQVNAAAPRVHIGKTDSSVAAGASATVSIWTGSAGSESDSGDNISGVFNRTSANIGSTKWVRVEYINDVPYMEPWQC